MKTMIYIIIVITMFSCNKEIGVKFLGYWNCSSNCATVDEFIISKSWGNYLVNYTCTRKFRGLTPFGISVLGEDCGSIIEVAKYKDKFLIVNEFMKASLIDNGKNS
ncbi:MAG: hypothetical protein IPQ11_17855 [Bacteroidetes bacterium]|jgi:hypothetical protein|nr:hypothetical protein [Bacteroidota bacterium]